VSCAAEDGDLVLVWKESGGPIVVAPAASKGFGSQLITRSVSATLGGSMDVTWPSEGALITLRMSKACLAA
jgi:two-component sensor histidine kinase